ncbi:MAG: hypothetical protein K9H63_01675 [Sphingobacteriaceae bacterium]|nr:hypothetical protein [Sphingobacteriaceae bacterium]
MMELSHALSDALLTLAGIFVYFKYLQPLAPRERLLWSAFILSVTAASFFGIIRFSGYAPARSVSETFQHLASTWGAICLVLVCYLKIGKTKLATRYLYSFVALGIVLFLYIELLQKPALAEFASMVAIPLVLALGTWGLIKGKNEFSLWLIVAVVLIIIANFNGAIAPLIHVNNLDMYHCVLALSILSFGKAAKE